MPYPISIHRDSESQVASSPTAVWAVETLSRWADGANTSAQKHTAVASPIAVRVLGIDSAEAPALWRSGTTAATDAGESFVVVADPDAESGLVVIGTDGSGIAYGVLEVLDLLQHTGRVGMEQLPITGSPSNRVRGIFRSYVSRVEDAGWYLDRSFWDSYLTELASNRFNRLQLAFGIGLEFGHDPGATDNYLHFAYPFLIDLPEFPVSVRDLAASERTANLDALRYASAEAARRGISFFVGFWTMGIMLDDGIEGDYTVDGITPENHAAYCREAIRRILEECPDISGVTLRVHYESGIPEPAAEFWKTVFEGVAEVGRPIAVDLHAKGIQEETIVAARDAGLEVFVTAKFMAEHLGLPYHQAAIRHSEQPADRDNLAAFGGVTQGARRFTRYGYADYLKRDRDYRVVYRHWPGTQRLLLWGDPEFAAGYSRIASFGGADGAEFFEPLAYKGRKGSGSPDGRQVYLDPHLADGAEEWRKYRYTYRLLGRLLYNPDADPQEWRRFLATEFGEGAAAAEGALGRASRILPLVTVAHGVSAANSVYWPEMYENLLMANGGSPNDFYVSDSQPPHTFGSAASLDPEMFTTIIEFLDELEAGRPSGRLTTFQVARWLDELADLAEADLAVLLETAGAEPSPAVSRLAVDVRAQIELGRFFADKLRTGVGYEFFRRTGSTAHLAYAVDRYQGAAAHWAKVVEATSGYKADLAYGAASHLRGHWADRQPAVDGDVKAMLAELQAAPAGPEPLIDLAAVEAENEPAIPALNHRPAEHFTPGDSIALTIGGPDDAEIEIIVHYRHANQAEAYQLLAAEKNGGTYTAEIPGSYTASPYDLVYFFEVRRGTGIAWFHPGLTTSLTEQPYFVVPQA